MPQHDHPDVLILPPVLYGGAFLLVLALHWLWPLPLLPQAAALWTGALLLGLGLALGGWGAATMLAAHTALLPTRPSTALVTGGPFRYSRNPLYLGLALDFLGLSLLVNSLWGALLLPPVLAVMHYGVILREESYLAARFGDSYRRYCATVRRYG